MSESSDAITGASILLDQVTKQYPGQAKPAVGGLTLEIPAGSIVMFVGPSGCGKTTTLKMINRLIEPSSGKIVINGEDVTKMDGDTLRRRIGYVIQAGGLFPHMTVAANIAIVPKMLGWNKEKISARVDELLELVSLDPAIYRDRYPKELSGGQQQRVGVARALAADPPVLLMDEPFGAVDPITRQRLQDELLNIQAEVQKTIVMVTHDFDEAVKLGNWIAVFDEGAQLVQYDSPERILANPANEFVENFIGSGAGLKQLTLTRVNEVDLVDAITALPGELASDVLSRLQGSGQQQAVVLDSRRRPVRRLSRRQLSRLQIIDDTVDDSMPLVSDQSTLNDALDTMLVSSSETAVVTGRRDVFRGLINVQTIMEAISQANSAATADSDAPVGLNSGAIPALAVENAIAADSSGEANGQAEQQSTGESR
ncbi:ABC transporter ATP-binding protein [Paeniglutamicibacter sp. Y32M11]|uniref:ABC transporter ATP-binding protein n=1 Tax=Paeniglutamicibacter sp. Y32M11 TaxID=2853258 RepID=UPI000B5FDC1C|nr:betaine/proline/choline family ABC transporter ATP-binding protein [Paeniglutamicibacter sp. Y32M11]ASN38192.1 ABC transporter [Arthrobacter sp. 7749]QXQ09813.1 betaine/proline/choline family ABC transporter ATP-binding protein [Paeniglutamicibacter sp. Y32M11]